MLCVGTSAGLCTNPSDGTRVLHRLAYLVAADANAQIFLPTTKWAQFATTQQILARTASSTWAEFVGATNPGVSPYYFEEFMHARLERGCTLSLKSFESPRVCAVQMGGGGFRKFWGTKMASDMEDGSCWRPKKTNFKLVDLFCKVGDLVYGVQATIAESHSLSVDHVTETLRDLGLVGHPERFQLVYVRPDDTMRCDLKTADVEAVRGVGVEIWTAPLPGPTPAPPRASMVATARGRDVKCRVCGAADSAPRNSLLHCSSCKAWYHKLCVGLRQVPRNRATWICNECSLPSAASAPPLVGGGTATSAVDATPLAVAAHLNTTMLVPGMSMPTAVTLSSGYPAADPAVALSSRPKKRQRTS